MEVDRADISILISSSCIVCEILLEELVMVQEITLARRVFSEWNYIDALHA